MGVVMVDLKPWEKRRCELDCSVNTYLIVLICYPCYFVTTRLNFIKLWHNFNIYRPATNNYYYNGKFSYPKWDIFNVFAKYTRFS